MEPIISIINYLSSSIIPLSFIIQQHQISPKLTLAQLKCAYLLLSIQLLNLRSCML